MNESTKRIVVLTFAQTILAFFGTIALLYSLYLTRAATRVATEAASVAASANEISRNALLIDQRPWISFRRLEIGFVGPSESDIRAIRFNFVWENTGKTPAVRSFCLTNQSHLFKGERSDEGELSIIGPGLTFMSHDQHFSPERIFESRDGEPIRLRSVVQYGSNELPNSEYVTDYTIQIQYIGVANLNQIKAGKVGTGNFWTGTRGSKTDRMT
jgi:hypothetical protein